MWIILATAILLFYEPVTMTKPKPTTEVTIVAPVCDRTALKKCTGKIVDIDGDQCKYWKQRQVCFKKAHCGGTKYELVQMTTNLQAYCPEFVITTTTHPTTITANLRRKADYYKCVEKLDASDLCKFWRKNQECLEKTHYNGKAEIEQGKANTEEYCGKGLVAGKLTPVCDRSALRMCTGKYANIDACKYWKRLQVCYKEINCTGENGYVHVISEIKKYCRTESRKLGLIPDCDSQDLADCKENIDTRNSCTNLKGELECYTDANCFDDENHRKDMEKKMNKACDCPCKLRSSCVVLVVMLALIKYLD